MVQCGVGSRRSAIVAVALTLLLGLQGAASAQILLDARRMGLGGLFLKRDEIADYNVAYRAVPRGEGEARLTIPIPLGLIQLAGDAPALDPQDSTFNAFEVLDLVLQPPLYLELREAPIPRSDVEVTVGKNFLQLDLGDAQAYIPDEDFAIGGYGRPLDLGIGFRGVRVAVSGFFHDEATIGISENLRAFLKEAEPAQPNTRYFITGEGIAQAGFAVGASYAFRALSLEALSLAVDSEPGDGLYLGLGLRYYLGVGFASAGAESGMTTGDTIFGASTPLETDLDALVVRSSLRDFGDLGRGLGVDLGAALVAGPVHLGVGVMDLGATLTWPNAIRERHVLDPGSNAVVTQTLASGVEAKTKLPVSYLAHAALRLGGTQIGGSFLESAGGASAHLGVEQWFGFLALRAGVGRDTRGVIQYGWGTGMRAGPVSLDVGFLTHSQSFSGARGLRLGTSISIY